MEVPVPEVAIDEAAKPGNTVSVRVSFRFGRSEIAYDQIDLPELTPETPLASAEVMPKVSETDSDYTFSNGRETVKFSKKLGTIVSWKGEDGAERITGPLILDAFRAPSSNEIPVAEKSMAEGLRRLKPSNVKISPIEDESDALAFTVSVDWMGARRERLVDYGGNSPAIIDMGDATSRNTYFTTVTRWRFSATGAVTAQTEIRPRGRKIDLLRLGWRFTAPFNDSSKFSYFGNGPFENYPDRKSGAFLGLWTDRVKNFYFPYARNEDSGNRENVRAFSYGGLTVSTLGEPFSIAVNPYTPDELIFGVHPGELPDMSKVEIGVYSAVRGLGGASCGPGPMSRDIIRSDRTYRLDIAFVPGGELVARSTDGFEFPEDDYVREEEGLEVVSVSSREPDVGEAEFAVDGDPMTIWHTQYGVTLGKHPHTITLDSHSVKEINGVKLLPRQDGGVNGRIKDCRFEVSEDGENWNLVGTIALQDGPEEQIVKFGKPVKMRFIRVTALSEQRGREWASLAEISLIEE